MQTSLAVIRCSTPIVSVAQPIDVTLYRSMAQVLFRTMFWFVDAVDVSSVSPMLADTAGGQVIRLHGSKFFDRPTLACR